MIYKDCDDFSESQSIQLALKIIYIMVFFSSFLRSQTGSKAQKELMLVDA